MVTIDPKTTALVIIDLQKGIASDAFPKAPYTAETVVKNTAQLIDACREAGILIVPVHVAPGPATALHPSADASMHHRDMPKDWAEFLPEVAPKEGDVEIRKQQWGAFYGTGLDLELRRRGITTIILCGISTNIGVESTARFAYDNGYAQVFAEDAMTAMDASGHEAAVKGIFPRMGHVRSTKEVADAIRKGKK